MEIKVLGTGCAKCKKLHAETEQAIRFAGIPATLTKVEDLHDIMAFGVMMTPALVIDGEVVSVGKLPKVAEIVTLIMNKAARG